MAVSNRFFFKTQLKSNRKWNYESSNYNQICVWSVVLSDKIMSCLTYFYSTLINRSIKLGRPNLEAVHQIRSTHASDTIAGASMPNPIKIPRVGNWEERRSVVDLPKTFTWADWTSPPLIHPITSTLAPIDSIQPTPLTLLPVPGALMAMILLIPYKYTSISRSL